MVLCPSFHAPIPVLFPFSHTQIYSSPTPYLSTFLYPNLLPVVPSSSILLLPTITPSFHHLVHRLSLVSSSRLSPYTPMSFIHILMLLEIYHQLHHPIAHLSTHPITFLNLLQSLVTVHSSSSEYILLTPYLKLYHFLLFSSKNTKNIRKQMQK